MATRFCYWARSTLSRFPADVSNSAATPLALSLAPGLPTTNCDGWARSMRSAEVTDIALVAFAIVLISALLIAFVSLH